MCEGETMGARTVMVLVCALGILVDIVVLPIADICGRHVERLSALQLAIIVTPIVHYIFQKGAEKAAALKAQAARQAQVQP